MTTANYSFPKRTAGLEAFRRSFESAMDQIDARTKQIEDRVAVLEGIDFGGGGEGVTANSWSLTASGMDDPVEDNFNAGDTITIGDTTYTFVQPGQMGELFSAPNQIATRFELDNDSNLQNFNGYFGTMGAIVYLIYDTAAGIAAGLLSPDTVAPAGVEIDINSYAALAAAIPADPDQSEGDWPALIWTSETPISCSLNTDQPFQLAPTE